MSSEVKFKTEILSASLIQMAEENGDKTCKYATFLISVLDEYDRMNRMIPYDVGEKYHETLRGFPIVAKLIRDRGNRPVDYGSHELIQWKNRRGELESSFGTYPIGSVVDTWIEKREVAGYEGEKNCVMAKAKLWTCRSPEYFKVLDRLWAEGKVCSSWEMILSEVEEQSPGKKILRAFSFIGNALLGTNCVPAVRGAGIYEYAENQEICGTNDELNDALFSDICAAKEQEGNFLEKDLEKKTSEEPETTGEKKTEDENTEQTPQNVPAEEQEANAANESKNPESVGNDDDSNKQKADDEPDTPSSEETVEALVKKVSELTDAILNANGVIQELQTQLDAMAPMKEEYDAMKQEKADAEKASKTAALKEYALKSGQITEDELSDEEGKGDESIKAFIANLDEAGLKSLIADRFVKSMGSGAKSGISTASFKTKGASKTRAGIEDDGNSISGESAGSLFIKAFLREYDN